MLPMTPSTNPRASIPGSTVVINAVAAIDKSVNETKSALRTPARSAMAPRTGEVTATIAIDTLTTRPHHRSPSPRVLPTTSPAK